MSFPQPKKVRFSYRNRRRRRRCQKQITHGLVPVQLLLRELVGPSMVEERLLQLGEDGLELLEGGLLGHVCGLLCRISEGGFTTVRCRRRERNLQGRREKEV